MSLTFDDIQLIRAMFREELEPVKTVIAALENDVKELYFMIQQKK